MQPALELPHHPIMSAEAIETNEKPRPSAGEAAVFEEQKASLRKRKKDDSLSGEDEHEKPNKRPAASSREIRLEQNRKAARESRRRKKNMYVRESSIVISKICFLTFFVWLVAIHDIQD
jgi:hypothetical protein